MLKKAKKVISKGKPIKKDANNLIKDKIIEALEKVRPGLKMDGGDVEFVSWNNETGIVHVSLSGMCSHCPMSQITLKQGIEVEVKNAVKEVKEVVAI
jgi:Fe-S cluster biogenesis protein NfuA